MTYVLSVLGLLAVFAGMLWGSEWWYAHRRR